MLRENKGASEKRGVWCGPVIATCWEWKGNKTVERAQHFIKNSWVFSTKHGGEFDRESEHSEGAELYSCEIERGEVIK